MLRLYLKHVIIRSKIKVANLQHCYIKPFSTNNSHSSEDILIKWINKDGSIIETKSKVGNTLLRIAHQNDIGIYF